LLDRERARLTAQQIQHTLLNTGTKRWRPMPTASRHSPNVEISRGFPHFEHFVVFHGVNRQHIEQVIEYEHVRARVTS
jgi:hypothetical protein